jgi:uncharacterized protein (TIGR04141 family)
MASELGKISIYLAKEGKTFADVIDEAKLPNESDHFKIRDFEVDGYPVRFFCKHATTVKPENPPWLDFVNNKLNEDGQKIYFDSYSKRPSGLLLINIEARILAASFGIGGGTLLKKFQFLDDFGIKAAMNMCGNKELRQTKSSTHAITTQNIDRQLSKPSDSFSFGLNETEFLQYISAHLPDNSKVTLQGKDTLTLKIIGDEKLSWDKLIEYGKIFIEEYGSEKYKELFPNYPNLQNIEKEKSEELDLMLAEKIKAEEYDRIHLSIPEFIADDEFSFSYTNYNKKENKIYSQIDVSQLKSNNVLDFNTLTPDDIKKKYIYAYSHEQDQILGYKKWELYRCMVAEIECEGEYFVLSNSVWRKVDDKFYNLINSFIDDIIEEEDISDQFKNISIADLERNQNREEVFNKKYCEMNDNAILFDQAKLRIGQGSKNKEFCDIFEYRGNDPAWIIHVKKHGGADAINYLFSQARFYCEFFLGDEVFLKEIRDHISNSGNGNADAVLQHVKENQPELIGKDYSVKMWILFDNKKPAPKKADLPLMAKYDLKLTYERLRNVLKYNDIKLSIVPVEIINFTISKKKNGDK